MSRVVPSPVSVPSRYVGLWQRRRLVDAHGVFDERTRVFWLQARRYYADIRIPPERPDFSGVTQLSECSDAQLDWLCRQQGFAGRLRVEGDLCRWVHEFDYLPPNSVPDAGMMTFDDDSLIERGVYLPYEEEWRRLPGPGAISVALQLHEPPRREGEAAARGLLLAVDDYFMFVHDPGRNEPALNSSERAQRLALLQCEISFGLRCGGRMPWQIFLSTLPFREGQPLFTHEDAPVRQGDGALLQTCTTPNGPSVRRWGIVEWTAGFDWF